MMTVRVDLYYIPVSTQHDNYDHNGNSHYNNGNNWQKTLLLTIVVV